MCATLRRGHVESLPVDAITLEVSSLKLSHDATLPEYSKAVFLALFSMIESQHQSAAAAAESKASTIPQWLKVTKTMLSSLKKVFTKWKSVLVKFGKATRDQLQLLYGLENACLSNEVAFGELFAWTLRYCYDDDVITEAAVLAWDDERSAQKQNNSLSASQSALMRLVQPFIESLRNASEDEEEGDDE